MANIKISELEELTTVEDSDVLPIVDISSGETKKVKSNKFNQDYFNGNKPMGSIIVDDIRSKNLFNISNVTWGKYAVISGTSIEAGDFANAFKGYVNNIVAGETVSVSANYSTPFRISYIFIDSSNNVLGGEYVSEAKISHVFNGLIVPANATKLLISQLDAPPNSDIKIQVEKGTVATNFSEYKKLDTDIYSFDTNLTYNSASPQSFQNAILKNAKLVICNFHSTDGNWDIQTQHLTSGTSFTSMQTSTNWYVASNFDSTLGKITFITESDNSNFVLNKITVVK